MKDYILGFWIENILHEESEEQAMIKKWNLLNINYEWAQADDVNDVWICTISIYNHIGYLLNQNICQRSMKATNSLSDIRSSIFFLKSFIKHFRSLDSQKMLFSSSNLLMHSEVTYFLWSRSTYLNNVNGSIPLLLIFYFNL